LDKDAQLPSGLLGVNVAGVGNDSWSYLCFILRCLATKPSHVGANVNALACFLYHPTVCGWQTWLGMETGTNPLGLASSDPYPQKKNSPIG
jgi:hypothetical protein